MENKFEICFAKDYEFKEIVDKLDLYFDKFPGYFESLVPVLYKKGKNTSSNHIVVKYESRIVGMIAVKENKIMLGEDEFSFVLLGSLAVDFDFRNQGIMGLLFEFILDKYSDCDFLGLSGKFDRYKRFGFYPSENSYSYSYKKISDDYKYTYELVNENDINICLELHNKEYFKVFRENMLDNLYMWDKLIDKHKEITFEKALKLLRENDSNVIFMSENKGVSV